MVTLLVYCWAAMARSVAVVAHMLDCSFRAFTSPVFAPAIIGSFPGIQGFTDQMTTGRVCSFITALVQLN